MECRPLLVAPYKKDYNYIHFFRERECVLTSSLSSFSVVLIHASTWWTFQDTAGNFTCMDC